MLGMQGNCAPPYKGGVGGESPSYLKTVMDFSFFDKLNQAKNEETDPWFGGLNRLYNSIISSRDFRSNQSKYLGLAARGESVILTSRTGSFKIVPISDDDSVMSKAEFLTKIESARNDIENGKGTVITSNKDLKTLLDSL